MFVEIVGRSVKTPHNIVEKAATFFVQYLLTKRLSETINLTIEFERFSKGCNDYAYCDYTGDNHRPKDFVITIDKTLSKRETLMALAHECVHLRQYATGELKDIFRPVRMIKWRGVKFIDGELDYWDQEWEWEAYGREKGLYIKFMASLKDEPV